MPFANVNNIVSAITRLRFVRDIWHYTNACWLIDRFNTNLFCYTSCCRWSLLMVYWTWCGRMLLYRNVDGVGDVVDWRCCGLCTGCVLCTGKQFCKTKEEVTWMFLDTCYISFTLFELMLNSDYCRIRIIVSLKYFTTKITFSSERAHYSLTFARSLMKLFELRKLRVLIIKKSNL